VLKCQPKLKHVTVMWIMNSATWITYTWPGSYSHC